MNLTKEQLFELYWVQDLTTTEIGKRLGMTQSSVWTWLKKYEIKTKPNGGHMKIRKINGIEHKLCRGKLHPEGKFLPLKAFATDPRAKTRPIRSVCKECDTARHGYEKYVSSAKYLVYFRNIVDRLGSNEAARRCEISLGYMYRFTTGKQLRMQRKVARRIVIVYNELKKTGEVRHRDSIKHGAYLRGREEKIPTERSDFYSQSDGDKELLYRRQHRQDPAVRERENRQHQAGRERRQRERDGLTKRRAA